MRYYLLLVLFSLNSVFAFSADRAKPKAGDGIYRFLYSHGRNMNDHYEEFLMLNKNKFGKNNTLLMDVSYLLPTLTSTSSVKSTTSKATSTSNTASTSSSVNSRTNVQRESLFGKKYAEYEIKTNKLRGATFYLVSGHGGPDSGAITKVDGHTLHEDEYAYDVMLRLARRLMMEGATVHIIIQDKNDGIRDGRFLKNSKNETCRGKSIPLNQEKRLRQRSDEINTLSNQSKDKYQRAVFIHIDSRNKNQRVDVFFYHNKLSATGKNLANTMRTTFRERYQDVQAGRGFGGTVSTRELFVLNNTKPISLFVELGNMQNESDQKRFLLDSNRQLLADWMCLGFIADYEKSKQ